MITALNLIHNIFKKTKNLDFVFILFLSFSLYAQSNSIEILGGIEYRITPIYNYSDGVYENSVLTSIDPHLSGNSINYQINYKIKRLNLAIGFGQSFRYDFKFYDNSIMVGDEFQQHNPIEGFIVDNHFVVTKYIKINKKLDIQTQIGISLMNRNTEYAETVVNNQNTPFENSYMHTMNYNFTGYQLNVGINNNKLSGNIGIYYTDNHNFNDLNENPIIIPFLKFQYKIFKF